MTDKTNRSITCKCCGKQFMPRYPNEKYCSLECRDKGRLKKRTEWKESNPDYYERLKAKNGREKKQRIETL